MATAEEQEASAVVPWDFGPPTGRGMRATKPLRKGDVVLRIPRQSIVTPRKCRDLLLGLAALCAKKDLPDRYEALEDLSTGLGVQVLDTEDEVLSECRAAGIDPENDEWRRNLLGAVVLVLSIDPSDDTVEVRRPSEPDGEGIWFPVKALRRPSIEDTIATISDENVLVTTLAVARALSERAASENETEVMRTCCPGLATLLSEMPTEVGLPAEWVDDELEGLSGSLHAARLRRSRDDLGFSYTSVQGLLSGCTSVFDFGTLTVTAEHFAWAWPRVASRHRSSAAFPQICGNGEGKTIMIPGGADMFNHLIGLTPGESTRESGDGLFIEVVAAMDCFEGDEVFISYGAKSNFELLLGYGFAVDGNPHDRVEIVLTLDKLDLSRKHLGGDATSLRATLCLDCISFNARSHLEIGREEADCELMPASNGSQPEVRIALSARDPLSCALLGLSRLERLSDSDLLALQSVLGPEEFQRRLRYGLSFSFFTDDDWSLAGTPGDINLRCMALRCELRALCSLRALFNALLSSYPDTVRQGTGDKSSVRALCCSALCGAEKDILKAACEKTNRLISLAVQESMDTARLLGGKDSCTTRVRGYLSGAKEAVQSRSAEVVQFFNELGSLPPLPLPACDALWSQTCSFFFLLLHGVLSHDQVDASVPDLAEYWSSAGSKAGVRARIRDSCTIGINAESSMLSRRWESWTLESQSDYLALFRSKTSMWGRYLFAQFLVTGALCIDAMSSMAMESIDIRKQNAWSVPTPEALEVLSLAAPLVEIGAGLALWAGLLQKRGVDVRAFELGAWNSSYAEETVEAPAGDGLDGKSSPFGKVECGGPCSLSGLGAFCDTLVLMWPDYAGAGSFGMECARRWTLEEQGKRIICVGEWRGDGTFGDFSPELPKHGQSFSVDCQSFIEEHFDLVRCLALPNWPLFLDGLRVFERRKS